MATYRAPLRDMLFVLRQLACIDELTALPGCADAGYDTARAVFDEYAKLIEDVVASLNQSGDQHPATLEDGRVKTSPGFAEAFRAFTVAGWQGLQHPEQFGGQGLPRLIAAACQEMLHSANLSFALCPMLTDGAIEALLTAGSPEQQQQYVPGLVSGEWTGTMNLTEPQAGSDLSQVRTKAVPQPDGSYRISGQKIFITWGEHDMAKNIVHLVLARTPDAPDGIKGISLFVVPKFLVDGQGGIGRRNDVWCASLEHKLGISASPTAVMLYGDGKGEVGDGGAIGYRIGEENRGLEYMFVMMNAARFAVGIQGIAVSERAYQQAVAFAKERVQSRDVAGSPGPVTIIHHPDVRRMLLTMRAYTEAARALAYVAAGHCDRAHHERTETTRAHHQRLYEYLVPIVKGWSTEMSIEVASLGIQVHGGMGFIEETGAAQYYRDARVLTLYEGTTAIQANDLVGRKTVRDRGVIAKELLMQIRETEAALARYDDADLAAIAARLSAGRQALERVIAWILDTVESDVRAVYAGSVPYLKLAGIVLGGWQMARAAMKARTMGRASLGDLKFLNAKVATAHFFADHILVQAPAIAESIVVGAGSVMAVTETGF